MPFLLAITTFFIVALVIFAVVLVTGGGGARQEIVQRRLAAVEKAQRRGAESLGLGLVRDDLYSEVPQLQRLFMRWSWPARLREYVRQAGLDDPAGQLVCVERRTRPSWLRRSLAPRCLAPQSRALGPRTSGLCGLCIVSFCLRRFQTAQAPEGIREGISGCD